MRLSNDNSCWLESRSLSGGKKVAPVYVKLSGEEHRNYVSRLRLGFVRASPLGPRPIRGSSPPLEPSSPLAKHQNTASGA